MILLFSHVRTGRWASVMPAKLAETLGLTDTLRAIPIIEPEAVQTIGLVVPAREPMMPITAALVAEAKRVAPQLDEMETAPKSARNAASSAVVPRKRVPIHQRICFVMGLRFRGDDTRSWQNPRTTRRSGRPRRRRCESAAGTFGRPGMVMISPQIATTNSAPAESRTSRT